MNVAQLVVSLASLGVVLMVAYVEAVQTSPGRLTSVHAAAFDGDTNGPCESCHGTDTASHAAACATCHPAIGEQLRLGHGLHGSLAAEQAGKCGQCHSEHFGDDVALVGAHSFRLAGVPDRDAFDHSLLDYRLTGRHVDLLCAECHPAADAKFVADGQPRFLGQTQACASCHEDPHRGGYGSNCEGCHGQDSKFTETPGFAHPDSIPLSGAHTSLPCSDCHAADTEHSVANSADLALTRHRTCAHCHDSPHATGSMAITGAPVIVLPNAHDCGRCHGVDAFAAAAFGPEQHFEIGVQLVGAHSTAECTGCHSVEHRLPPPPIENCGTCHESPHVAEFLDRVSAVIGSTRADSCVECHTGGDESFAVSAVVMDRVFHGASGFRLEAGHEARECAECHAQTEPEVTFAERFPGRAADDCASCHSDPHTAQFAGGRFGAWGCAECHTADAFQPSLFTPERHASADFPLAGAHVSVACTKCHVDPTGGDGPRVFRGAPKECSACHDDLHQGQFAPGPFERWGCGDCHGPDGFAPSRFTTAEHQRTPFPLQGAHAAVPCAGCHADRDVAAGGRRFADTPQNCAACHQDVHEGAFDRSTLPRLVGGRTGCARCHGTASFRDVAAADFDHGLWTGYELRGAHRGAACADCHSGRTAVPAPADCAGCHVDPHLGQFAHEGHSACARCHADDRDFAETTFDHERDAQFALDETHRGLECADCHRAYPTRDGGSVTRYRPLRTRCQDCHAARQRDPRGEDR